MCVSVLPPVPMCEVGKGKPMFLPMTPFHGDVIYATVGQVFKLHADAQVQEARYCDICLAEDKVLYNGHF